MSRGSKRRLCCSWSATEPRWDSRHFIPGCPMRTAKHLRSRRRCCRARCSTVRFWASSGRRRSASRAVWRISATGCCSVFGLLSMAVAAVFISGQTDYKRMLAYSSVEHMGILAVGVGLGGAAVFGAMLHVINHSLTKAMLFHGGRKPPGCLSDQDSADVSGALTRLAGVRSVVAIGVACDHRLAAIWPVSQRIYDPEGRAGSGSSRSWRSLYLVLLAIIMAAMAAPVLAMAQGTPGDDVVVRPAESTRAKRGPGDTWYRGSGDGCLCASGPDSRAPGSRAPAWLNWV